MASRDQNFGLIREDTGRAALKHIPIPRLQDDYILVRTVAIALNPTDWTTLDAAGDNGTLVGCDYAGVVEEVGKAVKRDFKKGDRIAGFAHGGMCPARRGSTKRTECCPRQ
jgi:NADPH:quinone reductase-like Zn-dependent oxidoreductase